MSWRHAASVIVVRQVVAEGAAGSGAGRDFRVLLVQRHQSSSNNAHAFVFPGGLVDAQADFDPLWELDHVNSLKQTKKFNYASCRDYVVKLQQGVRQLPAFAATQVHERQLTLNGDKAEDCVWTPAVHAFKIAAMRELFEECGVLPVYLNQHPDPVFLPNIAPGQQMRALAQWEALRAEVRGDARRFAGVCRERLGGVRPALKQLKEWSNWLTPASHPDRARFDTLFYLLFVRSQGDSIAWADLNVCTRELLGYEWAEPEALLLRAVEGLVRLAPPQLYELARLSAFRLGWHVYHAALQRQKYQGLERWCPLVARSTDGAQCYLLPGDSLYDEQRALGGAELELGQSGDELCAKSAAPRLNRLVLPQGAKGDLSGACLLFNLAPVVREDRRLCLFRFAQARWT